MKNKIVAFGFEIEGIFDDKTIKSFKEVGKIKGDGSVEGCGGGCKWCTNHLYEACEYNTNVIPYTKAGSKESAKIMDLFHKTYKDGDFHFNKTTGFHIHMSFKEKIPKEIVSVQYHDFMVDRINKKYHELLSNRGRLNNRYCKAHDKARLASSIYRESDRYRNINFMPSLQRHGTVEFRWFPTCEPKVMASILSDVLKWTNQFLGKEIKEVLTINVNFSEVKYDFKDKINNKKSMSVIDNKIRMEQDQGYTEQYIQGTLQSSAF
jgi:hypothetical protein